MSSYKGNQDVSEILSGPCTLLMLTVIPFVRPYGGSSTLSVISNQLASSGSALESPQTQSLHRCFYQEQHLFCVRDGEDAHIATDGSSVW